MEQKIIIIRWCVIAFIIASVVGCSRFLEVGTPNTQINKETVFSNESSVMAAIRGIHQNLFVLGFGSGGNDGISIIGGLSADEIYFVNSSITPRVDREEIQNNAINLNNTEIERLWTSFYTVIYGCNAMLEGLEGNLSINQERLNHYIGEVLFLRAFTYFYLVNFFGDVPLILSTNFWENANLSLSGYNNIYNQILNDLQLAYVLLPSNLEAEPMIKIGKHTASAMLARVHLYLNNWQEAENYSTSLIENLSPFAIEQDLNNVFLKGSSESIWSQPTININTIDAQTYITKNEYFLMEGVRNFFGSDDKRGLQWIALKDATQERYIPFKYKSVSSSNTTEYTIVLRLAEQFLIRSEARARLGDFEGAITDLNVIRQRAGLPNMREVFSKINEEFLISEILNERRKELFCEWGHRWLDLKRHNLLHELELTKPGITIEVGWFPIPEKEVLKNPKWKK